MRTISKFTIASAAALSLSAAMLGFACSPSLTQAGRELGSVELRGERCAGKHAPGTAHEILNIPTKEVFVAAGKDAIGDEEWNSTQSFRLPWTKNTTRNLLFTESCFFRSPETSPECQGQSCFSLTEALDHTWLYLSKARCVGCYPDDGACSSTSPIPPSGHLTVVALEKCHEMRFEGSIYELTDEWGNRYVMHSSGAADEPARLRSIEKVVLPKGWKAAARALTEPFVIKPRAVDGRCMYTIVRDSEDNSYHQISWDGKTQVLDVGGCKP